MKKIINITAQEAVGQGLNNGFSLEFLQAAQKLLEQGYSEFPFPEKGILNTMARNLFENFDEALKSTNFRNKFSNIQEPWATEPDIGILYRSGGDYDKKKMFQWKPSLHDLIDTKNIYKTEIISSFINTIDETASLLKKFSYDIASAIDILNPELKILESIKNADRIQLMRMLKYEKGCEIQAAEHTDKGLFTIHAWETIPGLQFSDGVMTSSYSHSENDSKTLVFLGRKFEKKLLELGYKAENLPLAIPHWVEVSPENRNRERRSLVYFTHDNTDIIGFQPTLLKTNKPV
jgi:hypothetical protein